MDQSPAVDAPHKGSPITAEWAARVADAANAVPNTPLDSGAFSSPFGSVPALRPQPMLGAIEPRPMPFDLRLVYNENTGKNEAYVALYPDTVWMLIERYGSSNIFYPSTRSVQSGSEAADASSCLARLPGFVDGATNYFVVWFKSSGSVTHLEWDIVAQQNKNRPAWANEPRVGPVIIGEYKPGPNAEAYKNPFGLHQFHRGLLWYNVSWVLGAKGTVADNACKSLGTTEIYDTDDPTDPANATKAISFDGVGATQCHEGLRVLSGEVNLQTTGNEITLNGVRYVPTVIQTSGGQYTVLAQA